MDRKNNLREIIGKSDLVENLKVFLLLNIDKFDDEQVDWLMKNL